MPISPSIIAAISVPATSDTNTSEAYLAQKHNLLGQFNSLEHLVVDGEESLDQSTYNGLTFHMRRLRAAIAEALWREEVFVSTTIIDEFVFHEVQRQPGQVVGAVMASLAQTTVHQAGFVIYPLNGFGLELPPLRRSSDTLLPYAVFKSLGMAVSAQSNSFETASARMSLLAKRLGIKGRIPVNDLHHYTVPSRLRWFTNNPLMMIRLTSHTGGMFENQFIYTLKIRIASSLLTMLTAIANDKGYAAVPLSSSSRGNNFSTLDIDHYLIGEAVRPGSRPLELRRVPMNLGAKDLARLSDLSVNLSTELLARSDMKRATGRLSKALATIESGYRDSVFIDGTSTSEGRLYARIVTALDWYRQSFGSRSTDDEAIVNLAVAFETLLADGYESKPNDRMRRRVRICLRGRPGVADYAEAVYTVMRARGAIVHNGTTLQSTDINKARAAFALCVEHIADVLPNLPAGTTKPMETLLNDPV
jgi:hypothetical protein